MKVELLYFDGCPSYLTAQERLRTILSEQGLDASIAMVKVDSDTEARRLRFPGSPTVRVDGRDLFPTEDTEGALGCRVYDTPEGLSGAPTLEMLREAIERAAGAARSS